MFCRLKIVENWHPIITWSSKHVWTEQWWKPRIRLTMLNIRMNVIRMNECQTCRHNGFNVVDAFEYKTHWKVLTRWN